MWTQHPDAAGDRVYEGVYFILFVEFFASVEDV
jgi:hypothetical protein